MDVVIFCGGMGTRLKEETEFKPKSLVRIGDRPIIWHIMKTYAHFGYTNFILCLGEKGEQIKEYFYNYEVMTNNSTIRLGYKNDSKIYSEFPERGWKITMIDTGEVSLKGARLKKVENYVSGDVFMATYGDGVGNIDIKALLDFHQKHGKMATITGVNPLSRFGELDIEGDKVANFFEKPSVSGRWISGGFMVFNRDIFSYLEDKDDCDLEIGCLERIASIGQLMVYKHDKFWACMDTYRDMEYLNHLWSSNKAGWKV